jgi:hypothetical protein
VAAIGGCAQVGRDRLENSQAVAGLAGLQPFRKLRFVIEVQRELFLGQPGPACRPVWQTHRDRYSAGTCGQ